MSETPPPWYRQFWPWFLFGLPGIVVVAGLTTWWIAAHNADSVVVDDYYKEGLAINREMDRKRRAEDLGLRATLSYRDGVLDVTLEGEANPSALSMRLSHPLDASRDRKVTLAQLSTGRYRVPVDLDGSVRWHWQLEPLGLPGDRGWRLDGTLGTAVADER